MNIFYLSADPTEAAQMMVDRHVVKMILESAQLLSTAHRITDGVEVVNLVNNRKKKTYILGDARESVLYQATHVNHPSAIWCRTSVENYNWLVEHMFALMLEYSHRYNKQHKCYGELSYMLQSPPKNLKEWDMTIIPCAMDDKYIISDDPVTNYRNYYKTGKTHLHSWKNREAPDWIIG
jgi:Pyrimidine dimer DNA glycosylase